MRRMRRLCLLCLHFVFSFLHLYIELMCASALFASSSFKGLEFWKGGRCLCAAWA